MNHGASFLKGLKVGNGYIDYIQIEVAYWMADLASYRVDLALVELAASTEEQLALRVELAASSDIHEYIDYTFVRYIWDKFIRI